jgi:hypothetical protein
VVIRGAQYFAVDDRYPRLSVPLEMMGAGEPKLLEWQLKEAPFKDIGTLRFFGGTVAGKSGTEALELVAVVDLETSQVVAIEPHKQGDKVAAWTWANGKATVASVDGVTDEIDLRVGRDNEVAGSGPGRRYTTTMDGGGRRSGSGWAPWNTPFGGSYGEQAPPQKRVKKKSKSFFDLLFN